MGSSCQPWVIDDANAIKFRTGVDLISRQIRQGVS